MGDRNLHGQGNSGNHDAENPDAAFDAVAKAVGARSGRREVLDEYVKRDPAKEAESRARGAEAARLAHTMGPLEPVDEEDELTQDADPDVARFERTRGAQRIDDHTGEQLEEELYEALSDNARQRANSDATIKRLEAELAQAKKAKAKEMEAKRTAGRVNVKLTAHEINAAARQCAKLLSAVVYMRGPVPSALVSADEVMAEPIEAKDDEAEPGIMVDGVRHAKGSMLLATPTVGLVQYHLDELAAFWRWDKRANRWVGTSCPKEMVTRLIDAATMLGYRQCAGIVTSPLFIRGEIIAKPGYHQLTGAVIAFNGKLPDIPDQPTKAEALAALDVLIKPFREYMRNGAGGPELRAAIAAAALTAVLRPSVPSAPVINIDANQPGAGKGKLARALCVIATGSLPAIITEGHNEEEFDKRISAAILSAAPSMLLDNIQRPLAVSALESVLTERTATIRVFGKLGNITVPFRSLVVITANNAAIRHDMLRRMLEVRIMVDDENPEKSALRLRPLHRGEARSAGDPCRRADHRPRLLAAARHRRRPPHPQDHAR